MSAQNHPNGTRSSPAGTVALITGAARGIGASIALRLAQDGFNLCVTDVPSMSTALSATADSIRKSTGRKVVESLGDVSKMQDVERSVQECVAELGRLDVAVANAGIAKVKPLLEWVSESGYLSSTSPLLALTQFLPDQDHRRRFPETQRCQHYRCIAFFLREHFSFLAFLHVPCLASKSAYTSSASHSLACFFQASSTHTKQPPSK